MSISLFIKCPKNAITKIYDLGGSNTINKSIAPLALALALKELSDLPSEVYVHPANLEVIIGEVTALEGAMSATPGKWGDVLRNVEQIKLALEQLRGQSDWEAFFG